MSDCQTFCWKFISYETMSRRMVDKEWRYGENKARMEARAAARG